MWQYLAQVLLSEFHAPLFPLHHLSLHHLHCPQLCFFQHQRSPSPSAATSFLPTSTHSLSFRYCYYGLSSCYEFVFYFSFWFCFSHPKPPIFFFFFSCFCFSHPKHRNPTKLDRNRMQSVGSVFFPHMSVLMFNI